MKVAVITSTQDKITNAAVKNSAVKLIPASSVLFVTRSGILAHSFPVATTRDAVTVNQDLKAIVPVPVIDFEYLAWTLRYLEREVLRSCSKHGTTVHSIEIPALKSLNVPIPPPKEQRRIVAKIEELFSELDKGTEALTTAREHLKAYRQSVLKHAFEGRLTEEWRKENPQIPENLLANVQAERKTRNPKKASRLQPEQHDASLNPLVSDGWSIEFLGNLDVEIFDGPFGSHLKTSDYVESGVRVIRLENIGHGDFIDEKRSFVPKKKYKDIQKHTVVPGDIVFSSFVTEAIRSALVPGHIPFAVNKADCFAIRFFGKTVNSKFVQLFLRSRNPFKQVEGMIHGVGRPRINTSQLKEVVIPICTPAEQVLIIEKLESIFTETDSLESSIETGLAQLAALRQSILKRAFSGQLVAQDPKDEPDAVLLERIRAEREGTSTNKSRNSKNGKSRKKNAA
jgi:type I restriction enzyme S subunit